MSDKILLVVDGTALAYRAYFAIPGLSASDGTPTNALLGFIKLLNQLRAAWKPTHVCVTFDLGLPAERMQLLPTYKAQREEMPDALRRQFPLINEYLSLARVPSVMMEGEEADDIMASLADWAAGDQAGVLMATSDKDMMQMVSERVSMVPLTKAGDKMGPPEVEAKTGVPPHLIAEWLALIGDTSDNIPGVPGVGDKTAARLLQQFGSIAGLYARLPEVKPDRIREAIATHREVVDRNIRMMSLRRNLPLAGAWPRWVAGPPDDARLLPFFQKLELKSMAREVADRMSRLF